MRKLIWMASCVFLSLALGFPVHASEPDAGMEDSDAARAETFHFSPAWGVSCELSGRQFGFRFRSVSGDVTEDDMQVNMTTTTGRTLALPLKPALYVRRGMVGPQPDLCLQPAVAGDDDTHGGILPAFDVGRGRVLLWLSRDNRPLFDQLVLVLVDVASGRVLDQRDTRLQIKDVTGTGKLAIRPLHGGAWQVRLVTEELPYSDTSESFIESWVSVRLQGDRIRLSGAR